MFCGAGGSSGYCVAMGEPRASLPPGLGQSLSRATDSSRLASDARPFVRKQEVTELEDRRGRISLQFRNQDLQ